MPCDSSYMEANSLEIDLSNVFLLLDELNGKHLNTSKYNQGYDKRAYNKATRKLLDTKTAELCKKLRKIKDISKYSLELQMWWRDHKKADKKRNEIKTLQ